MFIRKPGRLRGWIMRRLCAWAVRRQYARAVEARLAAHQALVARAYYMHGRG